MATVTTIIYTISNIVVSLNKYVILKKANDG